MIKAKTLDDIANTVKEELEDLSIEISGSVLNQLDLAVHQINRRQSAGRRVGVIHPSEVGFCPRKMYYSYRGQRKEEAHSTKSLRIFRHGHFIHDMIQDELSESFGEAFQREVPAVMELYDIYGHADGVIDLPEMKAGIEIKSINKENFNRLAGVQKNHKRQGTIYQACLKLPTMVYIYYNKNDDEVRIYTDVFDVDLWNETLELIQEIRTIVVEGDLPPPQTDNRFLCKECSYDYICKGSDRKAAFKSGGIKG